LAGVGGGVEGGVGEGKTCSKAGCRGDIARVNAIVWRIQLNVKRCFISRNADPKMQEMFSSAGGVWQNDV
jgi:hypothetical protein